MTPADVRERLAAIEAVRSDPERAHARRDDLWRDVLAAIAVSPASPEQELARVALSSEFIKFPEWTA